jgi:hypothetical protein
MIYTDIVPKDLSSVINWHVYAIGILGTIFFLGMFIVAFFKLHDKKFLIALGLSMATLTFEFCVYLPW